MNNAKKIIIVDDDENLLRLLVATFQSQGFSVVTLKTGKEAVAYLMDETHIASALLLILDRILPDMDGIDILRLVKEKYGDQIPILILSMLSAEKDVLEGLEKGAIEYLPKPFSINILLKKANMLINQFSK